MSKSAKKAADQAEREKVHKRYSNRREPDVIYPAKKQVDFYDADIHQRVAVYVRVSTDNLGQETSYELQKNYYEEFVLKHPNWKLVKIYADKGISGTSTKHRVELNQKHSRTIIPIFFAIDFTSFILVVGVLPPFADIVHLLCWMIIKSMLCQC